MDRGAITPLANEHSGIVNIVFCDGHVQALSITVDHTVYQNLSTRAGGEVIGAGAF